MIKFESNQRETAASSEQIKADIEDAITTLKQRLGSKFKSDYPLLNEKVLEVIADKYDLNMSVLFDTSGDEKAEVERRSLVVLGRIQSPLRAPT